MAAGGTKPSGLTFKIRARFGILLRNLHLLLSQESLSLNAGGIRRYFN